MKFFRSIPIWLALASVIAASNAFASGLSVTVVNQTQYTLNAVYASPSDASSWSTQYNLLSGTLNPGQQTTVTIPTTAYGCSWDMMGILYGAAQYSYSYQVNACSNGTWTITQSN